MVLVALARTIDNQFAVTFGKGNSVKFTLAASNIELPETGNPHQGLDFLGLCDGPVN